LNNTCIHEGQANRQVDGRKLVVAKYSILLRIPCTGYVICGKREDKMALSDICTHDIGYREK